MKRAITLFAAAPGALLVLANPLQATGDELAVSADTPTVRISTRPAGRNFIRLPDLDYRFAIDARCPAGLQGSAVSISIADTRIALRQSQLAALNPLEVPVTVPASQIGPVAVDRFCTTTHGDDGGMPGSDLTIPAVLSAQVSLLCAGESGSEMTYASTSLDVVLHCESGEEEGDMSPAE